MKTILLIFTIHFSTITFAAESDLNKAYKNSCDKLQIEQQHYQCHSLISEALTKLKMGSYLKPDDLVKKDSCFGLGNLEDFKKEQRMMGELGEDGARVTDLRTPAVSFSHEKFNRRLDFYPLGNSWLKSPFYSVSFPQSGPHFTVRIDKESCQIKEIQLTLATENSESSVLLVTKKLCSTINPGSKITSGLSQLKKKFDSQTLTNANFICKTYQHEIQRFQEQSEPPRSATDFHTRDLRIKQ